VYGIGQKKAREHSLEQNEFYNLITKTYTIQIYTYYDKMQCIKCSKTVNYVIFLIKNVYASNNQ